jgi:hypothetical protein
MALVRIQCARCGKSAGKEAGGVNRSRRAGAPVYCGMKCAGMARRQHKTKTQKREEKRLYDAEYRKRDPETLRAKKAAYFQRTYDPKKAADARKKTMWRHVEYCRRPEYVAKRKVYDRQHRAREYGEFAECYLLTLDVIREINSRISDYDTRVANGTLNKKLQRRRDYERLISGQP